MLEGAFRTVCSRYCRLLVAKDPFSVCLGSARYQTMRRQKSTRNSVYYILSAGVALLGLSFAAVPAYRAFCEKTSFGGTTQVNKDKKKIAKLEKTEERLIKVSFGATVPSSMQWKFKPVQDEIYVHPGETALAFYTAYNPTDRPIVGISSYNLFPFKAAYYFTKIQCFCFEEQILNPKEKVDLPVFFYIDPEYVNDPDLEDMDSVILNYTFFESTSNLVLPSPFDPDAQPNISATKKNRRSIEVARSPPERGTDPAGSSSQKSSTSDRKE